MNALISRLLLLTFLVSGPAVSAQEITQNNVQVERTLELARRVYARPLSRKILNEAFRNFLVPGQKEITETQLMKFLSENESVWATVEDYLNEVSQVEQEHLKRIDNLVRKYESELKFDIDDLNLKRLFVRSQRGQVPEAAIVAYLRQFGIPDAAIQEALSRLRETNALLENDLKPIQEKYIAQFKTYLLDETVVTNFKRYSNPLSKLEFKNPNGQPTYRVLETYVNHPIYNRAGKLIPESDLENEGYLNVINQARYELAGNVFDTDLPSVAAALANRTDLLERKWGIDKGNYDAKEEVKKVYSTLISGGVTTTLVVTPKLDHQKMIAIDYRHEGQGEVFLSTGNATQSCVGKSGDLFKLSPVPAASRPNANLAVLIKSDILASIVHHEIAKSVNPELLFKSVDFPVSGVYRLRGAGILDIAFTPNGANDSISKNFIVPAIDALAYPYLGGALFAFSSRSVADAIYRAYERMKAHGHKLTAQITIDKPFAMQRWSMALVLSGLKLVGSKEKKNLQYVEDRNSPWVKNLTPHELSEWRKGIRIASTAFQDGVVSYNGTKQRYTVKLHEKLLIFGNPRRPKELMVNFGSFNPSENAEGNQEYVAQFTGDPKVSEMGYGVVKYQFHESQSSVYDEALRRNRTKEFDPDLDLEGGRIE